MAPRPACSTVTGVGASASAAFSVVLPQLVSSRAREVRALYARLWRRGFLRLPGCLLPDGRGSVELVNLGDVVIPVNQSRRGRTSVATSGDAAGTSARATSLKKLSMTKKVLSGFEDWRARHG